LALLSDVESVERLHAHLWSGDLTPTQLSTVGEPVPG
jgi:hypothetical protein